MKLLLKIFFVILFTATSSLCAVNALETKYLHLSLQSLLPQQTQAKAQTKSIGTKVVNNTKKDENVKKQENPASNTDSQSKNSIKKIWEENNGFLNVTAELVDEHSEVKLIVYNMLGKEVRKIYQGLPPEKNDEGFYVFSSQSPLNLPKNIYILVLQGNTFKIADRFMITK